MGIVGEMTFDRGALTRDASLNRLVLRHGPHRGRAGGDVLSRDALAALVPGVDPQHLTDELDERPSARREAVAAEVGRRVAALVTTLRDPATSRDEAITEGRRRYLEEWQRIDDVVLGGGLLGGGLAEGVLAAAQHDVRPATTRLSVARHAPFLGLIGAARSAGSTDGTSLALDAGQTSIKPALGTVDGGRLRRVQLLEPVLVDGRRGQELLRTIVELVEGLRRTHGPLRGAVPCSIAAYVRDGRPIRDDASPYEVLAAAPDEALAGLRLIHDGTSAWRGTGRTGPSAVIVMGTWLGVGLGPPNAPGDLASLDRELDVDLSRDRIDD